MPSMKCSQCSKIKRCRMFLEAQQGPQGPREVPVYLCAPCARELGHVVDPRPADLYEAVDPRGLGAQS
jgi:hypothetical protein